MSSRFWKCVTTFVQDDCGQAIVEYGNIIAFVALLVTLMLSVARGQIFNSISTSFMHINGQMTALNNLSP